MPRSDPGRTGGSPSGPDLPCMPADKPVVERIGEPLPDGVELCILDGRPCILFGDWDFAEDWSGTFVGVIEPHTLGAARRVGAEEFWDLVRRAQAASPG